MGTVLCFTWCVAGCVAVCVTGVRDDDGKSVVCYGKRLVCGRVSCRVCCSWLQYLLKVTGKEDKEKRGSQGAVNGGEGGGGGGGGGGVTEKKSDELSCAAEFAVR